MAAVRALFEYLVMTGRRVDNPVPSPQRGQGLRRSQRGLLGHLGLGRARAGGRLVRQPRLLPESLPASDIDAFVATLGTHRDRVMVLAMLLGGLRSAEARGRLLADVDMGRWRLRVIGKGSKERHVPVDWAFFPCSPPICGGSAHPGWPHRSVSWCCADRPPVRRSARHLPNAA